MPTGARHAIDTIFRPEARDRGTLLGAARPIPNDQLVEGRANRLAAGITWLPLPDIVLNREEVDCDTVYDKTPRGVPDLATQPAFLLWDMVQCSIGGGLTAQWLSTVIELGLDPGEFLTAFLAMELETGAASGGLGLVGNGTYTPAVATSSAVSLTTAIADLETYLASTAAGKPGMRGVIHLTPALLTIAQAQDLVEWRDGQYRTATGHIVLGDAGHTGQATPTGQSAPGDGEAWVYATADVWYGLGEIHGAALVSGAEGGGAFYQPHNDLRPLLERAAILAFDPHVLGAALVSVSASEGGGGGGGDATAANQTTLIGHVDGIEALLNPTIVIDQVTADETIAAANYLWGYSLKETSGSAAAVVSIHHGANSSAPVIGFINLAASESIPPTMFPVRLPCPDGLHFEVVTGAVSGALYYEA